MKSKGDTQAPAGKGKMQILGKQKASTRKMTDLDFVDNPLNTLQVSGDIEADCDEEGRVLKQALRDADKRIAEEALLVNDTEYFFCVVFESREQKELFLNAMQWIGMGDKYLDGTLLARIQGIPLPKTHFPKENPNIRKNFAALVDEDLS